ncbi:MAG: fumarylacetoacetate hydrolase family protein [Verrucomicrobia bacterium]|nr:fumarylacetoacetate hydrolase family protein [Verrucomicrobiota bacterium]
MKIIRFTTPGLQFQDGYHFRLGVLDGERVIDLTTKDPNTFGSVSGLLRLDEPAVAVAEAIQNAPALPLGQVQLEAPLDVQEVWATEVNYPGCRDARVAASSRNGGGALYERIFSAMRPELFFKATPERAVGPDQHVRIRVDSKRSVPEPSLALVINYAGAVVGYTIGNDICARDLADDNPLYLPQAKMYRGGCALGPCILLKEAVADPKALEITMRVERNEVLVFHGRAGVAEMKRSFEELADYLFRENDFVPGVFLLTGAAVLPPADFTLEHGDLVEIEVPLIGVLRNTVE